MGDYEALKNHQQELIRKALRGSCFLAPITAGPIVNLTQVTGIAPDEVIDLADLPEEWDDLGILTADGASFSRDVSTSNVTSWGYVSPTRTDVTTDTSTMTVAGQETKKLTLELGTGVDLTGATPAAGTGEISIAKPAAPKSRSWRALALAVDDGDAGEIYVGRFLPRAKVSSYAEQAFASGDNPITWGATLTGEMDSTLGYSERWLFGGPGWAPLLVKMGFPALV